MRLHACDTKQVRFELGSSCVFSEICLISGILLKKKKKKMIEEIKLECAEKF
jgi:hypothetical protein